MLRETNSPLTMDIDIIKTLNEISKNENEILKEFKTRIAEYCNNEKSVFYVFKILKEIEFELTYKGFYDASDLKPLKPVNKWTDDKLNLIELIYAIYKTRSINHGKITLKEMQECFESLFQVKLGNISNRINEIDNRKGQNKLYLDILITNLNNFLEEKNL